MKNRFVAAFIAFTLGTLGINEFYCGNKTRGIIECLLSVILSWTFVVPIVISIINYVRAYQYIWCDSDEEFNNKFVWGFRDEVAPKRETLND